MTVESPAGGLKSVATTLDLLDCFLSDDELGVTEVARYLGVAKSSAHRMLTTLVTRGFAEKNPETGRYRLGLHLYELGQLSVSRSRLRRLALPLMEELRQLTGQTIHLAVADRADVVHVERLQSLQGMRLLVDVPRRFPSHCSASGKVLAAFDPAVAEARRRARFPTFTTSTLHSERAYDDMLAETHRRGMAVNRNEALVGLTSIAAPVCDGSGRARAALSIVGATPVLDTSQDNFARLVIGATRKLSRAVPWNN
jgi:DNA-binding IclR family transcriptional regulator